MQIPTVICAEQEHHIASALLLSERIDTERLDGSRALLCLLLEHLAAFREAPAPRRARRQKQSAQIIQFPAETDQSTNRTFSPT